MNAFLPTPLLASPLIALLAIAPALALAGNGPQSTLAPITVQQDLQHDCTPPSADRECAALHRQIRHTFNKREIGMLFGSRTSYPEYPIAYPRASARYQAFLRDVRTHGIERVALVIN